MALATDRATATFAPEQIGTTRYRTPEGFLLCEGVRIARTGPMLYAPEEMPDIEVGPVTTMITMLRDADVLFEPECVSSFAGKPVTNDHPNSPVTPVTFKDVSVGTVLNPRRGEGVEAEYLVADLLITDAQAIEDLDAGKREVSAGYELEVEQIKPGVGRQTKIVGNHVALVKRGRAGPACSIQDTEPQMAKRTGRTIFDRLRTAIKANDQEAIEAELNEAEKAAKDEGEGEAQRLVIELKQPEAPAAEEKAQDEGGATDPLEERVSKIEAAVQAIADSVAELKAGDQAKDEETSEKEEKTETKDEGAEEEVEKKVAADAMSKAEILAPGIRLPVFDSATVKVSAVTALQRSALKTAYADAGRKVHVDAVLSGRKADFDAMPATTVGMVFDAAAAVARAANNAGVTARPFDIPQGRMTAERYQKRIEERRQARA